jgi:hypothetical protein
LKDVGKIYDTDGSYSKMEISYDDITQMSNFLKRETDKFIEYSIKDAQIVVKHSVAMEVFNKSKKQLGVPLTLSSIGRSYVASEWSKTFDGHLPYQISGEYLLGNANDIQTPKGLFATGVVGVQRSYFIANYKGGRNESFMYGCDERTHWYDYDLTSAYTTGMTDLPLPDYYDAHLLQKDDFKK